MVRLEEKLKSLNILLEPLHRPVTAKASFSIWLYRGCAGVPWV